MGLPSLLTKEIPVSCSSDTFINQPIDISGISMNVTAVSMGNPHAVIFVDNLDNVDIDTIGPVIETLPIFPDRVNVEFARIDAPGNITMRVWERGSGITRACGTGACATLVAAVANGLSGRVSTLHLDGGDLMIEWVENTGHVMMTGPAATVFTGTYTRQNQGVTHSQNNG